jgi:hypothetical protein
LLSQSELGDIMVLLSPSFRLFALLSVPLASALSIPQQALTDDPENTLLTTDPVFIDDADFNVTDYYAAADEWNPTKWDYDVVIVGGGPAGLAASMSLSRVARTSLLYDSQEYRNEQTRYMHDVLGQDGMFPPSATPPAHNSAVCTQAQY